MDFTKLEKNIWDVMKEEQIKLGYRREAVRLYYPLLSLNRFLHTDFDIDGRSLQLQSPTDLEGLKYLIKKRDSASAFRRRPPSIFI